MRPVVVTAVLLLVVLMSMSASAEWTPDSMCRTKYPVNYCRKDVGPGWFQYGPNRCVKAFNNMHVIYGDAEKHCRKYPKGDLVSIHSVEELCQVECAMYRVTTAKHHYWIGMHRNFFILYWSDGSKFDYSHWASRQPDFMGLIENCVEMNYGGWGFWNDVWCNDRNPFVCQVKI